MVISKRNTKNMQEKDKQRAGIVARNKEETECIQLLKEGHAHLNTILNLRTNLVIERKVNWGNDTFYAGFYREEDSLMVINFRRLMGHTLHTVLEVLGHEIRHAVQYQQGWLPKSNKWRFVGQRDGERIESHEWKGQKISKVKYWHAPWEIDARQFQGEYAKMIIEAGVITSEQAKIKLLGERHVEILREATKKKILDSNSGREINWFVVYLESWDENSARCKELFIELSKKMNRYGFIWNGKKFVGKVSEEMESRAVAQLKAFNRKKARKKDGARVSWLALDQLNKKFSEWSKEAIAYAFKNHEELMKVQCIKWNFRELDLDDFVC